jgi:hypothetical protein
MGFQVAPQGRHARCRWMEIRERAIVAVRGVAINA